MHHHFPWRTLSCPLVHCLAVARLWHFDLVSLPERESNCKVLHDATTYNYMHLYTSVCVCIFLPLQYSALAVVNLWVVSPLPRGFVNSVTCCSEKYPRISPCILFTPCWHWRWDPTSQHTLRQLLAKVRQFQTEEKTPLEKRMINTLCMYSHVHTIIHTWWGSPWVGMSQQSHATSP